jgi:hypothetical protein
LEAKKSDQLNAVAGKEEKAKAEIKNKRTIHGLGK